MKDKSVVLIVDDRPENIQLLASCLKTDYHVKVATSGEKCLELTKNHPELDLILLDVMMPGLNGYEVIRKLKENPETEPIPVIFITGKDGEKEEELGLALGAVDYITKPIRTAIVKARVKTHTTLKRQRDQLSILAMCDQLTGLYNRHYLVEMAGQKIARALRHHHPLSFLMIDIDHFKSVNDRFGHAEGDRVLQAVATALQESCRKEDVVARLGGEEFVVMLDQSDISLAIDKAEQLRKQVEDLNLDERSVTVSIGVSVLEDLRDTGDKTDSRQKDTLDRIINRADKALYQAKEQGRNRVAVYQGAGSV
ncbi:diguanylate cyclase [Motiliproteus sp. MSK22-1]|uniref:GGDEF domain-containing response regulator n=1 Tax=Motiliproteus sp. MSK22-1 TaxID=1897630 RepID=UPI00097750FC|nr:diguanylate cyclase [Motiliproteus sp. MSK22-1]OMH31700.1 diguanylate cyclase response regulator [Motiliproteus sp. MSK22-1]